MTVTMTKSTDPLVDLKEERKFDYDTEKKSHGGSEEFPFLSFANTSIDGQFNGWKIHMFVPYDKIKLAFNLCAPILHKYFATFKVIDTDFFDKMDSDNPNQRFKKSAQFTIVLQEDSNGASIISINTLKNILESMADILQKNGLTPGVAPDSDAPLSVPFFSIRDSLLTGHDDNDGGYLPATFIGTNSNPLNKPNPYASLLKNPYVFNPLEVFRGFKNLDSKREHLWATKQGLFLAFQVTLLGILNKSMQPEVSLFDKPNVRRYDVRGQTTVNSDQLEQISSAPVKFVNDKDVKSEAVLSQVKDTSEVLLYLSELMKKDVIMCLTPLMLIHFQSTIITDTTTKSLLALFDEKNAAIYSGLTQEEKEMEKKLYSELPFCLTSFDAYLVTKQIERIEDLLSEESKESSQQFNPQKYINLLVFASELAFSSQRKERYLEKLANLLLKGKYADHKQLGEILVTLANKNYPEAQLYYAGYLSNLGPFACITTKPDLKTAKKYLESATKALQSDQTKYGEHVGNEAKEVSKMLEEKEQESEVIELSAHKLS